MCCGKDKSPLARVPSPLRAPVQPVADSPSSRRLEAQFEYTGQTRLTVVSPLTGLTYRFAGPGARTRVAPRDRPWMAFVPDLKRCE